MTREEAIKIIESAGENGNSPDLHGANLSGEYLRGANLSNADLSRADLSRADLSDADLSYAYLSLADLRRTDLRGADLHSANLGDADLSGANIDYSCWPLWFGSLNAKIDKRIAIQLLYHAVRAMQSVEDTEVQEICRNPDVLALANKFNRLGECGEIKATVEEMHK